MHSETNQGASTEQGPEDTAVTKINKRSRVLPPTSSFQFSPAATSASASNAIASSAQEMEGGREASGRY